MDYAANATAWTSRLNNLYLDSFEADPGDTLTIVSEWQSLMSDVPPFFPARDDFRALAATLDALKASRAFDSAAFMLIGSETTFMLSRSSNGMFLASVLIPQNEEEVTRSGKTMALALASAYLAALIAWTRSLCIRVH